MSRVTVIMPVYNGEKYIEQAIHSILRQTYQDFTLLCIDDGSTDNSLKVIDSIKDARISVMSNSENKGIAYTRNRGLELAETEYIALLDDDDIALPYRLEREVNYLDANPDISVVGGHQRQIDENGADLNRQWSVCLNPKYIKAYLLLNNTVVNGSTLFRKSFIEKHHIRYKDNMYGAEDYMFWVECSRYGAIKNLDEVMLLWRVAGQNETFNRINDNQTERYAALSTIRRKAFEQWGFQLGSEQYRILNKVFYEDSIVETQEELVQLYSTLKEITKQARTLKLPHTNEIITMCRKRFGEKVGKAFFLWDGSIERKDYD